MALQFVEWQPTNNKEREALRKFPFWVVSQHSSPLRQTSIFIVPIELIRFLKNDEKRINDYIDEELAKDDPWPEDSYHPIVWPK